MWLINSSVGKKVVMSVTGICLILFLTFHALMNSVALFSKDGYNAVCEFLGTNWYALVGTLGLAALAVLHLIYAFVLTIQNRKARGQNRYFVTAKPEKVEWASQNMFVLGIIIVLGLLLHLFNFWYNMMFAELVGNIGDHVPTDGYAHLACCPVVPPESRLLELSPDPRSQWQDLVEALAVHRHRMGDHHRRPSALGCTQVRPVWRRLLTIYV